MDKVLNIKDIIPKYNLNIKKGISYDPRYLIKHCKFDFDVKLNNGKNLQRGLVWSNLQKESLIISILKDLKLPTFCAVLYREESEDAALFKIIDGKQRLTTILSFINNEFPITVNEETYFFNNLDKEGSNRLLNADLRFDIIYEYHDTRLTDEQLISWFELVNFAGTQQDIEHLKYLKN